MLLLKILYLLISEVLLNTHTYINSVAVNIKKNQEYLGKVVEYHKKKEMSEHTSKFKDIFTCMYYSYRILKKRELTLGLTCIAFFYGSQVNWTAPN